MGDRAAERLYHLSTAESIRRVLVEEYGVAVTETSTVLAGWSIRQMVSPAFPALGAISLATHQRPPSPIPPHYGEAPRALVWAPYGTQSGPSGNPPTTSGSKYYAPEGFSTPRDGSRPGAW